MIPVAVVAAGKATWSFLGSIPWQAWAVAAILLLGWSWGEHRHDAGVEQELARWEAAQAAADDAAAEAAAKSRAESEAINTAATERGQAASTQTRTETADAVEKIRYEIRTVEVPAGCPVALPDGVREEGRAAVDRARAAAGALRARPDP